VEDVRLESTGKLPAVRYTALGVAVFQGGKIVRASWEFDVSGELTSAKPTATIAAEEFMLPGAAPQCLKATCEVRLQLRVELGSDQVHAEHTDLTAVPVRRTTALPKAVPGKRGAPGKAQPKPTQTLQGWEYRIVLAGAAMREQRLPDAGRLLNEALAMVEKAQGPGRPGTARVQYFMAGLHDMRKNAGEQEQALLTALGVLEKFPDAEAQKAIGIPGGALDKEIVARRLGDFYWEQRRFDRSYAYFERAYRYVAEVGIPEDERNRRLTLNSAGKAATACTQQNWAVAEQALKELKQRLARVDGETRSRLQVWAHAIEKGIAARKCVF
jgi:tetratricopeptide (TPR) repeat protein